MACWFQSEILAQGFKIYPFSPSSRCEDPKGACRVAGRIELAFAAEPRRLEPPSCWCRAAIGFSLSRLLGKVEGAHKMIITLIRHFVTN